MLMTTAKGYKCTYAITNKNAKHVKESCDNQKIKNVTVKMA